MSHKTQASTLTEFVSTDMVGDMVDAAVRRFLKSQYNHVLAIYKQQDDWTQLLYFIVLKPENLDKRPEFYAFIDLYEKDLSELAERILIDFAFLPTDALPLLNQYELIYSSHQN
jgi:hypothetical protein